MIRIRLWFFTANIVKGTGWAEIDWSFNWTPWIKPPKPTLESLIEARKKLCEAYTSMAVSLRGTAEPFVFDEKDTRRN